jgi:hypothetical protein
MATVLEEGTREQQRSVVRIFVGKRTQCKRFADDEEAETEVWRWLRQQPEDFYAAGSDALVKRWDKCINVGGGYAEK